MRQTPPEVGRPALDVAADPLGLRRRAVVIAAVGEPEHDVAERGELGIAVRSCSNCRPSSPCVAHPSHSRTIGLPMIWKSTSWPAIDGVERGRRQTVPRESRRIAGSRMLSTGLPSSTQSPSASRSAGTPGRPRREWRSTAAQGGRRREPVVTTWPTAPGTAAASSAPRSHSVRRMLVTRHVRHARPGVRSRRSRGRWTIAPATVASRERSGTMTSTGSSAGRGMPQRRAAERCDAIAPRPAASTAAWIAWVGARRTVKRATPGCRGSSWPRSMARYHDRSDRWELVDGSSCHEAVVRRERTRRDALEVHVPMGARGRAERETDATWAGYLPGSAGIRPDSDPAQTGGWHRSRPDGGRGGGGSLVGHV